MGEPFGGAGSTGGGGDFTTQGGLTGGGGGGVLFAPQFPQLPSTQLGLNAPNAVGSGSGGTTGVGAPPVFGSPAGGVGDQGFPAFNFNSVIPNNPGSPGVNEPSFLETLAGAGTAGSNFNVSQTFVDPAQQGFLDFLRNQASGVAAGQSGIGEFAFPFAQQLLGGGTALLDSLSSGAFADPLRDFQLNDSLIEGQISALGTDIDRQLQEFLGGAGGLGSEFVLGGTLGGGRQQVQEGIATRGAIDAFARESAGLRGADAAQRQQLGLDQATSLSQLQGGGQETALGNLQNLFNLGISPFDAQFGPLLNLSQILGDPTRLQETFGQGTTAQGGTNPLDLGGTADLIDTIREIFA